MRGNNNQARYEFKGFKFSDIRLTCCSVCQYTPSQALMVIGTDYTFAIITEGRGNINVDGKRYTLVAGEGFIVYPNMHVSLKADGIEPWKIISIDIAGDTVEQFVEKIGIKKEEPIIRFEALSRPVDTANDLFWECSKAYRNDFEVLIAFYTFLQSIEEGIGDRKIPAKNFYISRAIEYIKQNYNKNISVENIAGLLGIERSYLSRLFKTYKNKSTQNYIIDYRMLRAKQMFEQEDLNVSQVSAAVGYTNIYCFSRIFKSRVGMPPKEYMELCKRNSIEQD